MDFRYSRFDPLERDLRRLMQQLHEIFNDLLLQTNGDVEEALRYMDQWGRRMRNTASLHFIDNAGAQAALVKGSSSFHEGGLIAGYTWTQ